MDIDFICRHTNYTEEEATQHLDRLGDPTQVIEEYMKPPPKIIPRKNTHQLIFHEISKFMEDKNKSTSFQKR
jgi:hypothetical protein